jgi:hypothetical protein
MLAYIFIILINNKIVNNHVSLFITVSKIIWLFINAGALGIRKEIRLL